MFELLVAVLTVGGLGCAGASQPASDAPAEPAPAATTSPPPPMENPQMISNSHLDVLPGVWVYAADPRGGLDTVPLYVDSLMTFTAEGAYTFRLAQSTFPLEGTYVVAEWSTSGGVLNTDYGKGRTNQLHLALHEEGDRVVGYIVREGEKRINPRYYRRSEP